MTERSRDGHRSAFTSEPYTAVFLGAEIAISKDDKGRCMDNVFIECLLLSATYAEVYLNAYDTMA